MDWENLEYTFNTFDSKGGIINKKVIKWNTSTSLKKESSGSNDSWGNESISKSNYWQTYDQYLTLKKIIKDTTTFKTYKNKYKGEKLSKCIMYEKEKEVSKTTYKYNKKGDITKITEKRNNTLYESTTYTYDKKGNWIIKTIKNFNNDKVKTTIQKREFEYYD